MIGMNGVRVVGAMMNRRLRRQAVDELIAALKDAPGLPPASRISNRDELAAKVSSKLLAKRKKDSLIEPRAMGTVRKEIRAMGRKCATEVGEGGQEVPVLPMYKKYYHVLVELGAEANVEIVWFEDSPEGDDGNNAEDDDEGVKDRLLSRASHDFACEVPEPTVTMFESLVQAHCGLSVAPDPAGWFELQMVTVAALASNGPVAATFAAARHLRSIREGRGPRAFEGIVAGVVGVRLRLSESRRPELADCLRLNLVGACVVGPGWWQDPPRLSDLVVSCQDGDAVSAGLCGLRKTLRELLDRELHLFLR